ncbi:FMN-binding protein [Laribacter hongkongensis]|uniref:FMN-binding protein n=1 Tax=Laribacter hongkongensis TaxID=168471 RepID=UPI001EFD4727|nr:FMN-binding protein [Laribacter hongkongensis]MCG9030675.1 FMN-binding protein [Laribacter hongkongensis]MCG9076065.1 FMN-binding protein [Laribacter hongkongensis]MCG9090902.1 FMN-binding protein [Laribacter hongkongensis]
MSTAKQESSSRMILVLGGIALLCGMLIVLADELSRPFVEANRRHAIETLARQVVPASTVTITPYVLADDRLVADTSPDIKGQRLLAAYDAGGELVGVAAEAAARGYADLVHLVYGYDPVRETITGFAVVKMAETPGLGDKILTDKGFLANFPNLDARLSADGAALANPIVTVGHGKKTDPWQIDAIAGATVTSRAVGAALNQGAGKLLPQLRRHLETLRRNKP